MRVTLSLRPAGDAVAAARAILEQADRDPCILHLDRGRLGQALVFCPSEDVARSQRTSVELGAAPSPSLGLLEIDAHGVRAHLDCMDASRRKLVAFVAWIVATFSPCRVIDGESGEDLSELARRDPSALFA